MRNVRMLLGFCCAIFTTVTSAAGIVTDVTAKQRYPWNGSVDIYVRLSCESSDLAELSWTFAATNCETRMALPVKKIRQVGGDTGSGTSWARHFIWDAAADLGEVKIDDVSLTVDAFVGVQLWENGPYWAICNVGASKPEECGYYFWWGDTIGYTHNGSTWVSSDGKNSTWSFGGISYCPTYCLGIDQLQSQGYVGLGGKLTPQYDAATAHLGVQWRMPTDEEFAVLISKCTTTLTTRNGVRGYLVNGKGDYSSKSIFLPVTGYAELSSHYDSYNGSYYWSSAPDSGDSSYARLLYIFGTTTGYLDIHIHDCYRVFGYTVRPVRVFTP